MNSLSIEVNKNDFLRQFEAKIDGKLIKIEFSEQGKNIFLTRFEIDNSLPKDKYQDVFIKSVLDHLSQKELKVVPTCPIAAGFFKKHRSQYKHLLPIGISL